MFKVTIITTDEPEGEKISRELSEHNLRCEHLPLANDIDERLVENSPDLVIIAAPDRGAFLPIFKAIKGLRREHPLPIIAILPQNSLQKVGDIPLIVEDFVIGPPSIEELVLRVEKALKDTYAIDNKDLIRHGELVIDLARREVTLFGNPLSLTFTEYELLVFLAANSGRVFSRETLLNKIWGYDYYGGDRTVDVHIRRLRAKIEWGKETYIETVRGIGYRFRKPSAG